jgi:Methyltransferase domain
MRTHGATLASVNPAPETARDTRLVQAAGGTSSVGGVSGGEASTIKTVSGISVSTGKALQGELMFGRSSSGKPMFWLQGQDKSYALRGADGKPVSNAMDAETCAIKLITGGGATQLHSADSAQRGAEVKAPNSGGKLRINLEDPALNSKGGSGVSKGGMFGQDRGERGSALTSSDAVQAFASQGVRVTVFNSNPEGHVKNAHMGAMVELGDDARGGAQYAQATINRNPGEVQPDAVSYSLPKGSSAAFVRGYNAAARQIAAGQLGQAAQQVGEGHIGTRGSAPQAPSINLRPITTEPVPRSNPAHAPAAGTGAAPARTIRSAAASLPVRRSIVPKNSAPLAPAPPSVQGLLNLKGLSAHKLTASSARDLLADAAAIGPNPGLPELAGWLQRAFPKFMPAGDGVLGREVAQIVEGGAKGPVPKTLVAHADSRRWIRHNAGDLTTQHSAALAQAVTSRFSAQQPLRSALDLGSGNGLASRYLLEQASQPKVTAIDGDGGALKRLADSAGADARGRLTTTKGDVTSAAYGKNHDLVVAEKLFPHLNDKQVEMVLNKAHDAMSAKGVMVCDFYTTDHGSARSRGAQYRSEAQALALIPDSLRVVDKQQDRGILRLTLEKR